MALRVLTVFLTHEEAARARSLSSGALRGAVCIAGKDSGRPVAANNIIPIFKSFIFCCP